MAAESIGPAERHHGDTDSEVSLDLDSILPAAARAMVRTLLADRVGIAVEDAVQVTDELVSNAYRHGLSPRVCRLSLHHAGRRFRVEVDDAVPTDPAPRSPAPDGGRGLLLVARLASGWGVYRHADHKTVWAEITLDTPASAGHAANLSAVA
ncbi:MAG: ATP-binding protein [Labedaea sp.]